MRDDHTIRSLCKTLGVSRSGFYDWRDRATQRAATHAAFKAEVAQIHAESGGTYGSPRITQVLRKAGRQVGHNRVARALRECDLQGRSPRRFRACTTDSAHDQPIAPNRLAEQPAPTAPDQTWVTDITYVETGEGWLYLAGVLDLYSRRLIGWAMSSNLETTLPLAALLMALKQRGPAAGLLHHSDRGVQYSSATYRDLLAQHHLTASMSRRGNCYDNATMEAFWSTLKMELIYRCKFLTRAAATTAIFDYIERFYNRVRLHSSLGYQSPLDFESHHAKSTQHT